MISIHRYELYFSKKHIFYIYRDLKLHQNRWHCDCHLLNLRNWLQNFTVPNSIEPRCHSPPRLISESIKKLVPSEFACIPKVSPTSMYLEVIEGKNMSLVCSIEVSPVSFFISQWARKFEKVQAKKKTREIK